MLSQISLKTLKMKWIDFTTFTDGRYHVMNKLHQDNVKYFVKNYCLWFYQFLRSYFSLKSEFRARSLSSVSAGVTSYVSLDAKTISIFSLCTIAWHGSLHRLWMQQHFEEGEFLHWVVPCIAQGSCLAECLTGDQLCGEEMGGSTGWHTWIQEWW